MRRDPFLDVPAAATWAVRHFGEADLGDRRLSKDW